MNKIHHIGIVSKNLETILDTFNLKESQITETIDDKIQNNLICIIKDKTWLELIIPKNQKSTVYNFSIKNNVGIHHIGWECRDIIKEEQKIDSDFGCIKLGKYSLNIKSFGGKISTLFFVKNNMLTELIKIDNE